MANSGELQDFDMTEFFVDNPIGTDLDPLDFGDSAPASKKPKSKPVDKKQLNKQAADRYRRKKRAQFEELQEASNALAEDNKTLTVKCDRLESEVSYLKDLLMATVKTSNSSTAPVAEAAAALPMTSMSVEEALAQPDIPKPLVEMVQALAAQRKAVMDARFAALEEKIATLGSKLL
eukprot:m.24278 g.24278  ORF g.24278 m.24278 type:complete len:177 (+) comp11488_c0_seq1:136-666(+)